ncbi:MULTISPECIES: AI-2E family transporter [Dysgonomonas]|uniref:AI-2E family transporter n=1 Tax=Dysgonomonas TaxID=156973 RepID=UPI0009275886|nr:MULTISPECIES: AI-2E family transporter [Dysgonomonas]MBN9301897.1 AI-2E family transporter [Dysgonomonas mossii]OJX58469.1 MAG: AI-2E family transporter [Dysgonomonas sp. 37-18]
MENIKAQYWKYSLIILILFIGVVLFRELAPFMSGVLGASTIYVMVRGQMRYLTQKKNLGRALSAILIVIEAILCFLIPISVAVWLLVGELNNINLDPSSYISGIQHFNELIQQKTGYNVLSSENLISAASYLPKIGQILLDSVSSFIINSLVLVFVLYFMLIGGERMEKYLFSLLPFDDDNKKSVIHSVKMMVTSNAIGIPLLAIIQGVVATIGYIIFDAPSPILFGFLTCFATIIPLIGTSLIWFPLAVYLALTGDWFNAIGLAIYALIVISNSDNLIRFILQKKMADTHPLITVFGVIIGLTLFGFWGVIFGPLLLSVFILCIDIFKREYLDEKDTAMTIDDYKDDENLN